MIGNFQALHKSIQQFATDNHRQASDIKLVVVSKQQPTEKIRILYQAGQHAFAENRIDDLIKKKQELLECAIEWHFIGNIQSNKTRLIAENCDWVQSLDNIAHAKRLNSQRPTHLKALEICIQINASYERQKGGIAPEELITFATQLAEFKNLRLRGLMAIVENTTEQEKVLSQFKLTQHLFMQLTQAGFEVDTLSMGMSQDYALAIAAGSTMLRIGSYLFQI